MKKMWKKSIMGFLFCLACLLCMGLGSAKAATVRYASYIGNNIYTVGSRRYYTVTKENDPAAKYRTSTTLYEIVGGRAVGKLKLYPSEGVQVKAEYGNWVYFTNSRYGADWDLYRYNRQTKKTYLVRRNVGRMLIYGSRLYTSGFATDVSNVPIYMSSLSGSGAKLLTRKGDQSRMAIYGGRLYYLERTFNSSYTKISLKLVSRSASGTNRKVHGKTITTPNSVVYFNNKYIIYVNYSSGTRFYQMNLSTKKSKRIYPSQSLVNSWMKVHNG